MTAPDITPLLAKLKIYWNAIGITTAKPVTEASIAAFEQRWGVRLPADFREYVLTVNGGHGGRTSTWDENLTAFCGLDDMRPLKALGWRGGADDLFVFADRDVGFDMLAIRLSADPAAPTPIFTATGPSRIAPDFTTYLEGYVNGDAAMHWRDAPRPPTQANAPRSPARRWHARKRSLRFSLVTASLSILALGALGWFGGLDWLNPANLEHMQRMKRMERAERMARLERLGQAPRINPVVEADPDEAPDKVVVEYTRGGAGGGFTVTIARDGSATLKHNNADMPVEKLKLPRATVDRLIDEMLKGGIDAMQRHYKDRHFTDAMYVALTLNARGVTKSVLADGSDPAAGPAFELARTLDGILPVDEWRQRAEDFATRK